MPLTVAAGVLAVMVLTAGLLLVGGSRYETPIGPMGWTTSEIESFTDGEPVSYTHLTLPTICSV